jgi:hypothetical protein
MKDLLSKWIGKRRTELEAYGFQVTLTEPHAGGSHSVNIDSPFIIGTITYWPDDRFEFQFNSCKTGDVLLIEEKSLSSIGDLDVYFEELRREKLSSS